MENVQEIPIAQIKVGEHEQRLEINSDETAGLIASISRVGILVPLIIRRKDSGIHLVSGHRRLAAAKTANFKTVPCIERSGDDLSDSEVVFAENFFRKDLSPVELAAALNVCIEKKTMTVAELAAGLHKSEHWVRSMVAICGWPADVTEAIHYDKISISAGSNLALVTDNLYRNFLVRNAVEQGATARTTAAWLQAWRANQPVEEAITAEPVPAGVPQVPLIPQAPCLCCGQVFQVDKMSHVPMCVACIQIIRTVGAS